jgi:hypothetical protein
VVKDRPFGALLVWGGDVRENDVPAFNVFANQVAAALENARLYNEIQKLAIMDELTGLYNRRGFFALAQQHIHLAQRVQKTVLLVFADIDGMKEINDSLGHSMGDPERYRSKDEVREYQEGDPIGKFGTYLTTKRKAKKDELVALDKKAAEEVEAAVRFAEESPEPVYEDLFRDIYV